MPSRVVDEAWHELILDTTAYVAFCRTAFGGYLHHFPEGKERLGGPPPVVNTVWAWDRSRTGRGGEESALWALDRTIGIEDPWGIDDRDLDRIRASDYGSDLPSRPSAGTGTPIIGGAAAGGFIGGCGGGGHHDGGGGAGAGCGGGGCGGGGGGCGGGGWGGRRRRRVGP